MTSQTLNFILLAAVGVLTVWNIALTVSIRRGARRKLRLSSWLRKGPDVEEAFAKALNDISNLSENTAHLEKIATQHRELIGQTIKHVGLVRYDAFEELGGKLSFSTAFLDEAMNGVVITCINGRQESRVYAKPVSEGKSTYQISEEEAEAVKLAGRPEGRGRT